jgi:glycosyltransferase involved in cell wall biosynthesis
LKRGFDTTAGRLVRHGARAVVATSSVERDDLAAAGVDARRIDLRPNGVSFEGLWPLPARGGCRARFGIAADAPLVVTLARLAAIKQLPTLVRAVSASPKLHLLIAGPDEGDGTLAAIHAAALETGSGERVHVEPRGLWGADKASALADADVFCLPSDYESFGTAAAEAAGVGVPVVLTDRCGVKDVLPHARRVPTADVDALAEGLRLAVDEKAMAERSAPDVRERLSWSTLAGRQEAIYDSVR